MNESVFSRAKAVLAEVVELPAPRREERVRALCEGDEGLAAEVRSLLAFSAAPDERLSAPPGVRGLLGGLAGEGGATPGEGGQEFTGALMPGARVGGFTLGPRLGAGGMGVVFEATQDEPRRTVALKILGAGPVSDELLARFRTEVHVLGRLEHPAIASLYEAGALETEEGPRPFFAMPLVRGVSLTQWVATNRPSTRAVVELMVEICDAVAHAHAKGVVHRDLKPANILVDEDGRPTVLDFGVARLTDAQTQLTSLHTEAGQVLGTLPYMSPEQVSGEADGVDERTDVYALGVLLFEVLTGALPLELGSLSLPAAALVIQRRDPRRLRTLAPDVTADLDLIVDTALAKERSRRYGDAAALAADLRRHLQGLSLSVRPLTPWQQVRRTAARHRALTAGLTIAFVSLVVALVVSWHQTGAAEEARDLAVREADRSRVVAAAAAYDAREPRAALAQLAAVSAGGRGWEWEHLWQRLHPLALDREPEPSLQDVVVTEDGASFVQVTAGGRVTWHALEDGAIRDERSLDATALEGAQLAAGGRRCVAQLTGDDGIRIVIWDTASGARIAEFEAEGTVAGLVIAADGQSLAWREGEHAVVAAVDGTAPVRVALDHRIGGGSRAALVGRRLLVAGMFGGVTVVDGATSSTADVRCASTRISALDLSSDGSRFAFSAQDGRVMLRDGVPGEQVTTLGSHRGRVTALTFLAGDERLVSAGEDGVLRSWDLATGRELGAWPTGGRQIRTLTPGPEGRAVVARTFEREVLAWDLTRSADCDVLDEHTRYVYDVDVLPDGRAVTVSWDRTVRWWDTVGGRLLRTEELENRGARVQVSADGRSVAALSESSLCLLPNDGDGSRITLRGDFFQTDAMAWTLEGDLMVGPARVRDGEGRDLRLFDGSTGELLEQQDPAGMLVRALALSPDGRLAATGSPKGQLALLGLPGMSLRADLSSHADRVTSLAFSPDGEHLLSTSEDGSARIWRVEDGVLAFDLAGHPGEVWDAAWSPDGTRVATACHDGIVRLFDSSDGALVAQLRGHEDYVHGLAFTPDGATLVTGSGDGTVRLWHTRTLQERLATAGRPDR
jgi:WD40 repeat protein/serine/threonine protein kinase